MKVKKYNIDSQPVSLFRGRSLPESEAWLAGYAALIHSFDLQSPLPEKLAAISHQHKRYDTHEWSIYTPRYKPEDTLESHLTFALKHEGIDLLILKLLFQKIDPQAIEAWVRAEPTSQYGRRIWFLYEWLIGKTLNIPDLNTSNFVDLLDENEPPRGKPRGILSAYRPSSSCACPKSSCP